MILNHDMKLSLIFLLSLLLYSTQLSSITAVYLPGGIQSGPDSIGSTYASSAIYNINDNTIYITGATYGNTFESDGIAGHVFDENAIDTDASDNHNKNSSCFLSIVKLPTDTNNSMYWLESQIIQNSNDGIIHTNNEICTGIFRHGSDKIIVIGYTDNVDGSTLRSLITSTVIPTNLTGMMIQLDNSQLDYNSGKSIPVVGGEIISTARVNYPLEIFGRSGDPYLYVVSQFASNTNNNPDFSSSASADPFQSFLFGTPVSVEVNKFEYNQAITNLSKDIIQETFDSSWEHSISAEDTKSVYVSGITELNNTVIIVGYTSGKGDIVAAGTNNEQIDGTLDGFITKVSIKDGKYLNTSNSTPLMTSRRINSINNQHEQILGLCTTPGSLSTIDESFYVVGWTEGYFDKEPNGSSLNPSKQAFIMKLNPYTLDTIWTYQIGIDTIQNSNGIIKGISCAVTNDNKFVYFVGNIENDGVLIESGLLKSYGKTDIFIIKLNALDNTPIWTKQFGSDQNDEIAYRNGILLDNNNNPIIIGNTYGSIYRQRTQNNNTQYRSDVFVVTFDGTNGNMSSTIQQQEQSVPAPAIPTTPIVVEPTEAPSPTPIMMPPITSTITSTPTLSPIRETLTPTATFQSDDVTKPALELTDDEITDLNATTADSTNNNNNNRSRTIWSSIVMTICIMILLGGGFVFFANRRYSYKEVTTDRTKVLSYMACFDVEEIDLKHSATGGWHCSYTGKLARGINVREGFTDMNDNDSDIYDDDGTTLIDTDTDPLDPMASYSILGNSVSAAQRLLSSKSYESVDHFDDEDNGQQQQERAGILRTSVKNTDLMYGINDDRDNANNISSLLVGGKDTISVTSSSSSANSRRSSSSRKSASTSNNKKKSASNKDGGYDSLVGEYNTTWDQNNGSSSNNSKSKTSSSSKSSNKKSSSNSSKGSGGSSRRGGDTWGKDIV